MTRIDLNKFKSDFKSGIDMNNLSDESEAVLKNNGNDLAGIDSNKDGKIDGAKELEKLFNAIDSFDHNKSSSSFETTNAENILTPSGELYEALKPEMDRNLLRANFKNQLPNAKIHNLPAGQDQKIWNYKIAGKETPRLPEKLDLEKLSKLSEGEQVKFLQRLHDRDPKTFEKLVAGIRAGAINDEKLAMAVFVELLANTPWGKKEGQDYVDNLKELYKEGRLRFSDLSAEDALGKTVADNEEDSKNGKGTKSKIEIDRSLLLTPEGAAAVLAHESVHARHNQLGIAEAFGSILEDEVESRTAEVKVWSYFGKEKYKTGAANLGMTFEREVDFLDKNNPDDSTRMRIDTAADYAAHESNRGTTEGINNSVKIIDELFEGSNTKDLLTGNHLHALDKATDKEIIMIFNAYQKFKNDPQIPKSQLQRAIYVYLESEVQKRQL
ncbi:hypothetical protein L0244_37280 [bacterium]|nr:hypothetical protein [bacterium]